MIVLVKD